MFGSSFASSLPSSASSSSSSAASAAPQPTTTASSRPFFGGFGASASSSAAPSTGNVKLSTSGSASSVLSLGGTRIEVGRGGGDAPASSSTIMRSGTTSRLFGAPSSGGGGDIKSKSTSTSTTLPFSGFGGGGGGGGGIIGGGISSAGTKSGNSLSATASSALIPAPTARAAAPTSNYSSVENSCMSIDGRSFHSYLYDSSLEGHVIISEFAPFGDGHVSAGTTNNEASISSFKITTILSSTISDATKIDPVIGLICVDGSDPDGLTSTQRKQQHHRGVGVTDGQGKCLSILPWMCLYTRTSAFVISIGYEGEQDDDIDSIQRRCITGTILQVHEPFEKQLLMSPRGSSILRIRAAPGASSSSSSMFHRCGSMAMLLREGGLDEMDSAVGYILALYHGLPESIVGVGGGARGKDFDGRTNPSTEGSVTTPLRFGYEELVRGMNDTVDAENAAYNSSSLRRGQPSATSYSSSSLSTKRVVDFCFMNPPQSTSGVSGFAAASILVLCNDGSVYGASPIIFNGTILPRIVVVSAISHLDAEIEASTTFLQSISSSSPAPTVEQECTEARMRQCRAARRYLLDAFGIPDGSASQPESRLAQQGSYYVSASVVHSRSYHPGEVGRYSQALAWQPRLQGPLILPRQLDDASSPDLTSPSLPFVCIESFGGRAGADIIDGFVVARAPLTSASAVIDIEFGILPGEGSVLLPRFEFESHEDCQLIDDLVRGTGVYVERASIINGESVPEESGESRGSPLTRALTVPESNIGRSCSIVVDPLDDVMIHVVTRSRVVTVTTNAVAVTAESFLSRISESAVLTSRGDEGETRGIRTKIWSSLEVNSSTTTLVGVRVSGDVHLGHISLARISDGSLEVVNITATQCIHETSELMRTQSEHPHHYDIVDNAFRALESVQPLHEILQPLLDRVCDGLSKMGKIVGGQTLPQDAGPENLALFLETQHSCKVNILVPMEEVAKVLSARRELLKELYDHQSAELVRLSALIDEFKEKYNSHVERAAALELSASILATRSSALLTATRELRPQITDAEAAYFKDLLRYETSCNKWEDTVNRLHNDATSSCDAMSADAIGNGEVQCLVDLPPPKVDVCHKLLRSEGQILKKLEQQVKDSCDAVEQLSTLAVGLDAASRLRILGDDKENHHR